MSSTVRRRADRDVHRVRDNGLLGNVRVLGWLLGRESTRFADAVRAELPFSVMEP
jgi:hypothetical protein